VFNTNCTIHILGTTLIDIAGVLLLSASVYQSSGWVTFHFCVALYLRIKFLQSSPSRGSPDPNWFGAGLTTRLSRSRLQLSVTLHYINFYEFSKRSEFF